MKEAANPTAVLLTFGLCLAPFSYGSGSLVKRSDDTPPLQDVVQQQAATIQTLQAELAAMKNEQTVLKNRLATVEQGLQREEQHKQMAFHVRFSGGWETTEEAGSHGTLKFNSAITNVGNAYSTETGVFTAPFAGTYLFILGAMTKHDYGELVIKKTGGSILAMTYNQQPTGILHLRDTTQAAVHLKAGEQVWVETFYRTTSYQESMATIFTGVLVEAD